MHITKVPQDLISKDEEQISSVCFGMVFVDKKELLGKQEVRSVSVTDFFGNSVLQLLVERLRYTSV